MRTNEGLFMLVLTVCWISSAYASSVSTEQASGATVHFPAANEASYSDHGISANVTGGYRWGNYSSHGVQDEGNSGAATTVEAGYHFATGWEVAAAADFAFPQMSSPGQSPGSNASFFYEAFGVVAGYLWLDRFEPFIQLFPFAGLSQSTTTQLAKSRLSTDLTYSGAAYGAGAKVDLTDRKVAAVQVGLKFSFIHEAFSRASISSNFEAVGATLAGDRMAVASSLPGDQNLSGNAYQLALFIGI